jgi:hypothetical protein
MTHFPLPRFPRRAALALGAVPLLAAVGVGGTALSASAATTTPTHHQRCDETLTYEELGGYFPQFVLVRDVCDVQVFHQGGYGRHHQREEDVAYTTERHGQPDFHFVRDVRDVQVFH